MISHPPPDQLDPHSDVPMGDNRESDLTESQAREPWRFRFLAAAFGLLTFLVLIRIIDYQVFPGNNQPFAKVTLDETTPRGIITDRNGDVLAFDRFFTDLIADPSELNQSEIISLTNELVGLTGLNRGDVLTALTEPLGERYAPLAEGLPLEVGEKILAYQNYLNENNEFGPIQKVTVEFSPQRYYPEKDLSSHLLGLVSSNAAGERIGYYGIEGYYNRYLRQDGVGLPGRRFIDIHDLPYETRRYLPSVAGKDVILTIDRAVQMIVQDELRFAVKTYRAESGSIIVMDPKTGAILAMANYPDYDVNNYGTVDAELWDNPAVSAQYEPGSIFKIITMAAALDTGVLEPTTVYTDTGRITLGQKIFFNSNRSAVGRTTAEDALARSLNVVTVQIAQQLGTEDLYQYIRRFGFSEPTEIDLSGEVAGIVKFPHMSDWSLSDLGANSFGQGLAVTPLQMIAATAAIANGGKLMRPYTTYARVENNQVLLTEPTVIRQVISPETAEKLTNMMITVVDEGAPAARVRGYVTAGKTGTAQIPTEFGYSEDETIVSFVGFAPAVDPEFVVLVKLDRPDPKISPWASYTAAPTFRRVTQRLLEHYGVPPSEERSEELAGIP